MRLPFLFLIVIGLDSCSNSAKQKLIITDPSRDTSIQVAAKTSTPTTAIFTIKGEASDTFMIMDRIKIHGGKIDKQIQMDFYDKVLVFKYNSYKARQGKLEIDIKIPGDF